MLWFILLFLISTTKAQAQIIINEFEPNPNSGSEWVELYVLPETIFPTLAPSQEPEKWQIFDAKSEIGSFISENLLPGDLFLIEVKDLNNSGDSIELRLGPAVIDSFTYEKSNKEQTWARVPNFSGEFFLSDPSPNQLNPEPSLTVTPTPTKTPTQPPTTTCTTIITNEPKILQKISPTSDPPVDQKTKSIQKKHLNLQQKLQENFQQQTRHYSSISARPKKNFKANFQQKQYSKPAIFSVIIGGMMWLTAAYLLYEKNKT